MGCCIGEKHSNWCKDYDIVYIDADGKEYCIFHAPAECKFVKLYDERAGGEKPALMGAEQFNGLVFERIDGVIEAGVDEERDKWDDLEVLLEIWNPRCNFSATIFPYDIIFLKYDEKNKKYIPTINLIRSQFKGIADFSSSHFKGIANFNATKFNKDNYFSGSKFKGNAHFNNSVFNMSTDFSSTQFKSNSYFKFAKFNKHTTFARTTSCKIVFYQAYSLGKIYFDQATFADAIFDQMTFKGPAYFSETEFTDNTTPASFKNTIFHDYSNFEQTKFKGGANFHLAFFKEWSYFRNAEFGKETTFAGAISKETILLESVDLSNLKFAKTNIESFKFIDCKWGDKRFAKIYDEKYQKNDNCNDTTLAEIYRRLKRIARESSDEEQTSHWHYREKEMTRKSLEKTYSTPFWNILITAIFMIPACTFFLKMQHEYFLNFAVGLSLLLAAIKIGYDDFKKIKKSINKVASKLYLTAYKLISGYGEDPIRAGAILFCLVTLPFLIQFILNLTPWASKDWLKIAMWYMPLIKIDLYNSQGYHYLLKGLSVSAITLQAALFGFALRNKLRR